MALVIQNVEIETEERIFESRKFHVLENLLLVGISLNSCVTIREILLGDMGTPTGNPRRET